MSDLPGDGCSGRSWGRRELARGALAGFFAGIPQVVAAQIVGTAVGDRQRADIAPRLVQRVAEHLGTSLPRPARWILGIVFHFAYAAMWGTVYAAAHEALGRRSRSPLRSGGALGAAIYTLAFSRLGMGTQLDSEPHPDRRGPRATLVQATSVLSFSLTVAYAERWLRERWRA